MPDQYPLPDVTPPTPRRTDKDRLWPVIMALALVAVVTFAAVLDARRLANDANEQSQRNRVAILENRETGYRNRALNCLTLQTRVGVDAMRAEPTIESLCFADEVRPYYDPGAVPREPEDER